MPLPKALGARVAAMAPYRSVRRFAPPHPHPPPSSGCSPTCRRGGVMVASSLCRGDGACVDLMATAPSRHRGDGGGASFWWRLPPHTEAAIAAIAFHQPTCDRSHGVAVWALRSSPACPSARIPAVACREEGTSQRTIAACGASSQVVSLLVVPPQLAANRRPRWVPKLSFHHGLEFHQQGAMRAASSRSAGWCSLFLRYSC